MITLIIPVYNEKENIHPLLKEISLVAKTLPIKEIIYVDDASTDETPPKLAELGMEIKSLRVICHSVRSGQSAAFMSGVRAASTPLIVFMDGDGQNDPADIQKLFECYQQYSSGNEKRMVAGQRVKRQDNWLRRQSSVLANRIRSWVLNDQIRDTGCSLKLIRREDYLRLPYFNHMHRFLPALMARDGVEILTVDVSHRPRARGVSKYGFWDRLWVGVLDLIGVKWLLMRGLPKNFTAKEIR